MASVKAKLEEKESAPSASSEEIEELNGQIAVMQEVIDSNEAKLASLKQTEETAAATAAATAAKLQEAEAKLVSLEAEKAAAEKEAVTAKEEALAAKEATAAKTAEVEEWTKRVG